MSDKHRSNQIFLLLRHLVFLANKAVPVRQAGWRSDSKDGVVSERKEECAIGSKEGDIRKEEERFSRREECQVGREKEGSVARGSGR
ncbi:hypothetical protein Pcinc_043553 [Petrolisthes cinctipes]|uniref:Uncharacterized protein n=1 Tax=Petrolisthes cinctipes TaxID=88211 RepID=A0AAE1BGG3_PETCI|nr:hypothetical protein Pcinc_043553 [Petrolisthes cinctipes]